MKRNLQSLGVLFAIVCCTLAYATTSNGTKLFKQFNSSVKQLVGVTDDSNKLKIKNNLKLPESVIARALQQVQPAKSCRKLLKARAINNNDYYIDTLWYHNNCPNKESKLTNALTTQATFGENSEIIMHTDKDVLSYAITATDLEQKNYAWTTKKGMSYNLCGDIKSESPCTIKPCLAYLQDNSLYVAKQEFVVLDTINNNSAHFDISADNLPKDVPVFIAFIVYEDSMTAGQTITVSNTELYAYAKIYESRELPYDSIVPELGLTENVWGDKYIVKCDSSTTIGVVRDGNNGYITGIVTNAETFEVPISVILNGEVVPIISFGYNNDDSFNWSHAQSLTTLIINHVDNINNNFSGSAITDIYRNTKNNFYGDYSGVENIYLHLPYGAKRNDYYGFKRILIGDEKPYYPEPDNSDFVIKSENEDDFFGISESDEGFIVSEIFTDKDTIALPLATPYNEYLYTVNKFGHDSYNGYGSLCKHAPNLKAVVISKYYYYCDVNWSNNPFTTLYIKGDVLETRWNLPSSMTVYVCNQKFYSNYLANNAWRNASIQPYGWDFELFTIDVARKGEFAQTYIEKTDANWDIAMNVKVTGTLNETDLNNIKNITNLRKLDLSEAKFDKLPNSFLQNKTSLIEVVLPDNITEIESYAFNSCSRLEKVVAPGVKIIKNSAFYYCQSLTDIDISKFTYIGNNAFAECKKLCPTKLADDISYLGESAFYRTGITEITIPETITSLNSSLFYECSKLTKVTLPNSLVSIGNYAFYRCTMLQSIDIPESVVSIGYNAFYGCKELREITIPSNVQSIGSSFISACDSIMTVKCKSIVPPTTGGNFTNGLDLNHCVLYVAPFAIDAYREADNWKDFYIIKPLNEPVKNIYINRPMSFDLQSADNAVLQENPNMTLTYNNNNNTVGQLSASGDGTLSAGVFNIFHSFDNRDKSYYEYANDYRTTLVNNAENMRADSVVCTINFKKNTWHFISFQYDVMMKDIVGINNTDFVIRQYNSANRAQSDSIVANNNWEDVAADGVLQAGKGYIIQVANNGRDSLNNVYDAVVTFPSRNTVTKNKLFASTNVIVPLEEYPAEFAHNRSWNLVGNPYPCYYDMHFLQDDFTTPIVVWRGRNYQVYSPVDDDIILRPNEAFFVQRPIETEQMTFGIEGRLDYTAATSTDVTPGAKAPAMMGKTTSNRSVFNFNVEGSGSDDRARIVMNEKATMNYNINTDACKFFAEQPQSIELYVNGDVRYDICERPLANGIATLGMRVATAGTYTLSLNGRNIEGWTVILTDTETGSSVVLNNTPYLFEAKAGETASRFVLTFKQSQTNAINGIETSAANVRIVNTTGAVVFEGNINNFRATAPAGVYVVVEADKAYKIVVK